jgi:hypothetical protein
MLKARIELDMIAAEIEKVLEDPIQFSLKRSGLEFLTNVV